MRNQLQLQVANALDSHRLIAFANSGSPSEASSGQKDGLDTRSTRTTFQTRLVEALFTAYFEQEQDITSHAVLTSTATRAGVDTNQVKSFLAGDDLAEKVHLSASRNRGDGVNGVPHFVVNDSFMVEGAQEPAAFLMLFRRLKKRQNDTVSNL